MSASTKGTSAPNPEIDFDVAILGGGPGGSLTAALVRRQDPDRRVLVLEREKFPRHHVGESTIPSWQPILERAGVLEKMHEAVAIRKVGGRFLWGRPEDQSWTLDFRERDGAVRRASFHVDRAELDQLLLDHARSLGAEVHEEARVTDVTRREDGAFDVQWEGPAGTRRAVARYVVDASGQARLLSRLWKLEAVPFDAMNNYAVWAYWKGSRIRQEGRPMGANERWTVISTCDDGWVWHIPIGPDLVSVGVVTEAASLPAGGAGALETFYLRNVRACPEVGELVEGGEIVQHPLAPGRLNTIRDWAYCCERVCGDGWFLVGDAALFVDPILSTGLLITSNGASMAANALHTLWTDPSVDAARLLAGYDATYREAGMSFHRLARIWYARNFKRSSWHWEAKRQRLRTGRDPYAETSAEAFFHLCVGSFADPIEGAFSGPMVASHVDRPDARIMASHLFTPEERAHLPGSVADSDIAHPSAADSAEDIVRRASDARWSLLLASRLRVRGCTWRRDEGYFTDRTMDRWVRVAYVEVRAVGSTDPFDRVVFPSFPDLPEAILPLLDGTTLLRDLLPRALSTLSGRDRDARLDALRRQVLQLDHGGFLDGIADAAPPPEPEPDAHPIVPWRGPLPPPIASALAETGARWRAEVDVADATLRLVREDDEATMGTSPPNPGAIVLLAADKANEAAFAKTGMARLWYPGSTVLPATIQLLRVLATRVRAWEAAEPEAAKRLWEEDVPGAGR